MSVDNCEISLTSFVSVYNQIMLKTEISGTEASILPIRLLRLDISDIMVIINAELIILIRYSILPPSVSINQSLIISIKLNLSSCFLHQC
jgi:hypothetical protein